MLLCTQEEYSQVFDDDKRELMKMTGLMTWTIVCTFKKIHRWLRSAETERKSSKGYLRSSELRQTKQVVKKLKKVSIFPCMGTKRESKNDRTHGTGRVH